MATITTDLPGPAAGALAGQARKAVIYRMRTPQHVCPSGLKALDLLKRHGVQVEDHPLLTREATDAFKAVFDPWVAPLW